MNSAGGDEIWITGIGAVSPGGWSAQATWDLVAAGGSGIRTIERFDVHGASTKVCGAVPGLEGDVSGEGSLAERFATAAVAEAVAQAGLDRADVVVAANHGERSLPLGDRALVMSASVLAQRIARQVGATASLGVYGACAGGNLAIGTGVKLLQSGEADTAIVGGSDCLLREFDFFQFCNLYAMSVRDCDPEEACCPFDRRRDGFVLAEGAGFLAVERSSTAMARGATPLARILGFGSAQNAYHIVASPPDARGPSDAMRQALRDAGVAPEDVDYINAHGTSTRDNDWCETLAIRNVFGSAADRLPVSSSKGALGHTMAAAGAIEAVLSVQALRHGVIPPTRNLVERDEQCDLDYVPGAAREASLGTVMSNSFGFGGHSTSLVLGSAA